MDLVIRVLTIIGGIALFLFGMKLMSEALQRVAGSRIRKFMGLMTSSTWKRILSGTIITSIVQSSSAVTVMIVSFVNAGILTLRQSIGMIMGANIGTTITAWVICIFGFHLSVGSVAVPLAGLGFALIMTRKEQYKAYGNIVMGFSLLFIGLSFIQNSMDIMVDQSELSRMLFTYSNLGYPSIFLMVIVGMILTIIIQSSSVTIALTLVMASSGWLPLEAGIAMILGENIGTTITANIAAIVANTSAKRAALAHTLINLFGVLWMTPLVPFIVYVIEILFSRTLGVSPNLVSDITPFALAFFHTMFNVINTLILVGLIPQIIKIITRIIPYSQNESRRRLSIIDSGLLSTAELSTVQAMSEITNHSKRVLKMFGFVRQLMTQTDNEEFENTYFRVEKYVKITDTVEREIIAYLAEISRADVSQATNRRIQNMFRIVSHLETIAEGNLTLAKIIRQKRQNNIWFSQEQRDELNGMFDLIEQAQYLMITNIENPSPERFERSKVMENEIDMRYAELRDEQMDENTEREYKYQAVMIYTELLGQCEKIGDSIINVCTTANE